MDDCDLEKLSAAPAKLSPKFNRNVLEYEATVPSSTEKVKVDCLTSDSGASYQVFVSLGTVDLRELFSIIGKAFHLCIEQRMCSVPAYVFSQCCYLCIFSEENDKVHSSISFHLLFFSHLAAEL